MTLVASFVGVWIKISLESDKNKNHFIASLVGAWIKIKIMQMINIHTANLRPTKSLGVRETESMAVGD